jgi:hypothetical protein
LTRGEEESRVEREKDEGAVVVVVEFGGSRWEVVATSITERIK